ncbi:MAG: ATP-binding cassette domain-containing protein [Desulfobacteraceae bacterium]|nr:ATP-binding cassette domain-containing protein [Desulfobacteraceae bacterium]
MRFIRNKLTKRQKHLFDIVIVYWRWFIIGILFSIIGAASSSASAYLVKPLLDDVFMKKDATMLFIIPGLIVIVSIIKGFASYGREYFMKYIGLSVIRDLRDLLYSKIIDLPLQFFHKEKVGVLMARITHDAEIVKTVVSSAITDSISDVLTLIGLIGVVLFMDWQLAIGTFLILPIACYPIVKLGRRIRKFSTGVQETMADLNSFLLETFSGIKIVKIFTKETYEKKRFSKTNDIYLKLGMKRVRAQALSSPIMEILGGVATAFIVWIGGSRVIEGTSTPGTFFAFLAAVVMMYGPVRKLSKLYGNIQPGVAAIHRVYDILEEESEIIEPGSPVLLKDTSFNVEFKNVQFQYNKEDGPVLNNINLKVASGEVLALVGMSGGGKTSLVNLVPRFFDITKGDILIGNKNIKDLSIISLREHISIVTQEPILFNETVRDNIRYGKTDATDEEIEAASKAAYAYDFVQGFPKGFETRIGELGNRLSGGEKQRICIARALIKNAPILILDEATSALDAEAERVVQKALGNLMKNRTTFVIAHRLSTIEYADRVILLKNGEIKEQGTHYALMEQKGEYYKLQTMQNSKGEKNDFVKGFA